MKLSLPFPENASWEQVGGTVSIKFVIPENYPYLEGHFPGNPLVPAVTQIAWVTKAVEILLGKALERYRLSRFKFIRAIKPSDSISVSIVSKNNKYSIRVMVGETLCSAGNLMLENDV